MRMGYDNLSTRTIGRLSNGFVLWLGSCFVFHWIARGMGLFRICCFLACRQIGAALLFPWVRRPVGSLRNFLPWVNPNANWTCSRYPSSAIACPFGLTPLRLTQRYRNAAHFKVQDAVTVRVTWPRPEPAC